MTNFGAVFIVDRVVCGKSDGNIKDAEGQIGIKFLTHMSAEKILLKAKMICQNKILWSLYLTEFLTDFGQILDSKSYDQA